MALLHAKVEAERVFEGGRVALGWKHGEGLTLRWM